jgi:hypothetical protein
MRGRVGYTGEIERVIPRLTMRRERKGGREMEERGE